MSAPEPWMPVVHVPTGGWPALALRLEVWKDTPIEQACYELALASREMRRPCVALIAGVDLIAFPHQTVDEIAQTRVRIVHERRAAPKKPPTVQAYSATPPPLRCARWTPQRKLWVVEEVIAGRVTYDVALGRWSLEKSVVDDWIAAYQAHGYDGLRESVRTR